MGVVQLQNWYAQSAQGRAGTTCMVVVGGMQLHLKSANATFSELFCGQTALYVCDFDQNDAPTEPLHLLEGIRFN